MDILQFDINDLQNLESLLQISTNINNIYETLSNLEINNQKDSIKYKELINKLKNLIIEEKKEYQRMNFTYEECIKYLKLFEAKTNIPSMNKKITTTLTYTENKIIRRIMLNLLKILENKKEFHQQVLNNGLDSKYKNLLDEKTKKELLDGIKNSTKIENAIDTDIHSMFLSILEETISYKSNIKYKDELIKAKYCILFTHNEMESIFINKHFTIPNEIYISSKITNEILKQSETAYNQIKQVKIKTMVKQDINILLNLKDNEYEKNNVFFNSIITACHIRTLISIMEHKNAILLESEIYKILNDKSYMEKHQNDRISESIIISCFTYLKKDREKVRTLSIKN